MRQPLPETVKRREWRLAMVHDCLHECLLMIRPIAHLLSCHSSESMTIRHYQLSYTINFCRHTVGTCSCVVVDSLSPHVDVSMHFCSALSSRDRAILSSWCAIYTIMQCLSNASYMTVFDDSSTLFTIYLFELSYEQNHVALPVLFMQQVQTHALILYADFYC